MSFHLESGLSPSNLKFFADKAIFLEFSPHPFLFPPHAAGSVIVQRKYQASFYLFSKTQLPL
jgi:hypothetical protein